MLGRFIYNLPYNKKEFIITIRSSHRMSAYQHRRNFSLLSTQSNPKPPNRSLHKIPNPSHSWLLVAAKQYYHKTNNLKAAINNFQEYLAHHPQHAQSLYLCAICYMHSEEYGKAIGKLREYLAVRRAGVAGVGGRKLVINLQGQLPSTSQVYLLLSMAYNKVNNQAKSMETINQALRQDNKFQQGYCFRAKLYLKISENEKAFYDYKQVLKINPKCWEAWVGLGDYYSQVNNYGQALKCYEKVKDCMEVQGRKIAGEWEDGGEEGERRDVRRSEKLGQREEMGERMENRRNSKISERLQEFMKKPKPIQFAPDFQTTEQLSKPRSKLPFRSVTSPSTHITPKLLLNAESQGHANFFKSQNFNPIPPSPASLPSSPNAQTLQQIDLKMATCLYYLGQHTKSINLLQGLLAGKAVGYFSEIYYFLAANQIKVYELRKIGKEVTGEDRNQATKRNKDKVQLKSSFIKSTQQPQSQPLIHLSPSQLLHQAILNLQSSIRSNNNKKIMTKSCKLLLKLYIENNQFYETSSILQLAEKYQLDVKEYRTLSEVCMMVIKQKYEQALPVLKRLGAVVLGGEGKKGDASTSERISELNVSNREKDKARPNQKVVEREKDKCSSLRLSAGQGKSGKLSNKKSKINEFEYQELYREQEQRQQLVASTGNQRRMTNPIGLSLGSHQASKQQASQSNEFKNLSIRDKLSPKPSPNPSPSPASSQLQWMIPQILLFRAYSEYFSDNFIECLEIYEQYENYIKDYLGKEPEQDIYLSYNKVMCEGILMLDNEMVEESLEKFVGCVENYYRILKAVAIEPILFRVLGMIRLAISENPYMSEDVNSRTKIYVLIIEVLDHYMPAIGNNPLVHYYYALALYELEKYKEASDSLEKCLKIAQECTWKFLYVKGVIEIKNKLYKDAVREFSAGLLVEEKPEIYLGRCICYIQLFEQSQGEQQVFMQKSFEDLQKYIELEDNKEKISKWVTKILFFNKAYEQVTKSIKKVSSSTMEGDDDMIKIQKCLNIYNGIFEDGGVLGQVLINAFQGKFEDTGVEINGQRHEIILSDFVDLKYKKWLRILNLYSAERYPELIKYLQMSIFEQKNQDEALELRYNLAIVYYLSDQPSKADNVIAGLAKYLPEIAARVQKFINKDFSEDQCVEDLQIQLKGVKRLSSYLPYRKITFNSRSMLSLQSQRSIYAKISLPFPQFFKPEIDLSLDDTFIYGQTAQTCIPKKIQAPWIKKVTGHVQFTDNVVQSHNTSLFDNDVLSPPTESKQQSSLPSSLKQF